MNFRGENKDVVTIKDIPKINACVRGNYYSLDLMNKGIDDNFLRSFISSGFNRGINELDLRNNKLTYVGIEVLVKNVSLFPNLQHLELSGNEIGDIGMKILSPHLHLLANHFSAYCGSYNIFDCSKMGLSSIGLKYLQKYMKKSLLEKCFRENINKRLIIHDNPIGNDGFKLLVDNIEILMIRNCCTSCSLDLSNISIDDESVILLANTLDIIKYCDCDKIYLNGNNIRMNGLKTICSTSKYPYIVMKNVEWTNEEVEFYLDYCSKRGLYSSYDFSNMNINDSHISIINQIYYCRIDLSNNKITSKGLKELMDCFPKDKTKIISIYNNNEIGNEGIEIICKYFHKVVDDYDSLNLSNIGMSEEGLKMLIERLKDYKLLEKINISGNELNEEELILMKENQEVFDSLDELSITMKENIDKSELKSFFEIFSTIGIIKIDGISKEEKKELSKEFFNIE